MYALIRTLHLIAAFALAAFLLMYAASGFVMSYEERFPSASRSETRELPLRLDTSALKRGGVERAEGLAVQLRAELGLRGRPQTPERRGGRWHFAFDRPGTVERVVLVPGARSARLTVEHASLASTLSGFHHLRLYRGGPLFVLWAVVVDVVAVAMILFAASGVYLWYVLKRDRLGWILLTGSTSFVAAWVIFFLLGR